MAQINKAELAAQVAEATEISKKEAGEVVEAVIAAVTKNLAEGNDVVIAGLGKFVVRERAARTGKNPQTGEKIEIAATKVPAFVAAKALKDAVKA
jgi:DNA-binding protein HU-beta